MVFRGPDGELTLGFWWAATVSFGLIVAGIWGLVAPQSLRRRYFGMIRALYVQRGAVNRAPTTGWGWGSPLAIRICCALAVVAATVFMTWVVFFTRPGVAY